jgi:enoyl-CoA hydratase/carnithine racemase
MVADRRVAASDGRFAANFARLGFHPGFGMSVTVPRALGETVASDLLLTGRRIDAHEALRLGVVERVTEPDELRSCAHAMAVEIATSAPLAVRSIRTTLRGNLARQVREVLVRERFEQERLMATEDFAEGVAAINERRTPRFKGIQA